MSLTAPPASTNETDDPLWPQRQVKSHFGVCDMTIYRWTRLGLLPEPIKIRNRNYFRRSKILDAAKRFEQDARQ